MCGWKVRLCVVCVCRRLEERWRKAVARRRGVSREGDLESDSLRGVCVCVFMHA